MAVEKIDDQLPQLIPQNASWDARMKTIDRVPVHVVCNSKKIAHAMGEIAACTSRE